MNHTPAVELPWSEIAQLIRATGHQQFARDCLTFLHQCSGTDHLALLVFDQMLRPRLIDGASPPERNIVFEVGKVYASRFYLSDPNVSYIVGHRGHGGRPSMFRLRASDINDDRYREQIYECHDLLERLSWIGMAGNTWYSANLYRDKGSGYYTEDELATLHAMGDALCALFEQHILKLLAAAPSTDRRPSPDYLQQLITQLQAGLSQREIEVCARALLGMTRTGIALDLDIKPNTVATLTQRAHTKLNISSVNELFALCLQLLHARQQSVD